MARIRSVKPDMRRSLTVAEWKREVRLAWIYLWMYLDDEGRGLDDMRLIVAELFPLDRDVTEKKMDGWLTLMATTKTSEDDMPPLCRYEVAGRKYLHATKWEHQKINRPQPSRLPPCPIHGALSEPRTEPFTESSVTDSPPSRAPADQGAGKGAGSRDQGAGNARATPPDDTEPSTTERLVAAWIDRCTKRPPGDTISRVGKAIATMLAEGIDPADINRGLIAWQRKGLGSPTALAGVVHEVMNAPPPDHRASAKANGWLTVDQPNAIEGRPA